MMENFKSICLILIISVFVYCGQCSDLNHHPNSNPKEESYDGYKVLRIWPENDEQLLYLQQLSNDVDDMDRSDLIIDFWSIPMTLNSSVDLMIAPQLNNDIKAILATKNITTETLIDDVGRMVEMQRDNDENSLLYSYALNDTTFFQRYQPLSNIHSFVDDIARFNPDLCTLETIGQSGEGRAMKLIKIGFNPSSTLGVLNSSFITNSYNNNNNKPIVYIDAGIHAREWISTATATYLINRLIKEKDNSEIASILKTFDFHILPSANPDGYEYSRLFDRFWRKTRSRNSGTFLGFFCAGVDPNRNYGYEWGRVGSSGSPCSNTYHGPRPFSEPETAAIASHVMQYKDRIKLFLSLHSYSQLILTPWGYTKELPKDYAAMMRIAEIASRAFKMSHGSEYRYGSSAQLLYAAAGGSDDWAYGTAGIRYSFTIELPDRGTYGFLLPARYIIPTGEETFDAIIAMLNEIKREL